MKIEPKELGVFQKFWLRLKFPKIPSEDDKFITISKDEYNLMKKIIDRDGKYLTQITNQTKEIRELKEKIDEKERQRRKTAGKVGGMQKELNKWKQEKEEKKQN